MRWDDTTMKTMKTMIMMAKFINRTQTFANNKIKKYNNGDTTKQKMAGKECEICVSISVRATAKLHSCHLFEFNCCQKATKKHTKSHFLVGAQEANLAYKLFALTHDPNPTKYSPISICSPADFFVCLQPPRLHCSVFSLYAKRLVVVVWQYTTTTDNKVRLKD